MMKKTVILVFVLLVACGPSPTAVPPSNPASPSSTAIPTTAPQALPTVAIQPTVTAAAGTPELWIQILSPLDEAVVGLPQVDVTGSASAGAVLSINDDILIVGADQQFKTTVELEEGPNLIEIIASDETGNELTQLLTVIYEP